MTVYWTAPRSIGWILSSWVTGVFYILEEYRATVRGYGKMLDVFSLPKLELFLDASFVLRMRYASFEFTMVRTFPIVRMVR